MIVVRVREDLSFEVVDREKSMVRLGAGGLDGKALTSSATSGALRALTTFKRIADSHKVDTILAAATSATREAPNGGEFLARIETHTGIRPRIIAGQEEARLIHMAATYGVNVGASRAVVIDIGGGSVELTLGDAASLRLARSLRSQGAPLPRPAAPRGPGVGASRGVLTDGGGGGGALTRAAAGSLRLARSV